MKLTNEQQNVFNAIENTKGNYFITGKPGSGKSFLINYLVEYGKKNYTLTAPTGLAALNIGGRTLHSIFRMPVFDGIYEEDYNNFVEDERAVANIRYNVKHLIIDEVSMVRADTLDYIDRLLQHIKDNNSPFGGIQVIIVGDFFQLPPVTKPLQLKQLYEEGYATPFAFSSRVFNNANFTSLELTTVLRQKDDKEFIEILHSARTGKITMQQCGVLNKNVGANENLTITLAAANVQADTINFSHLKKLPGDYYSFKATQFGTWPALPVEELLKLKIGAQVMVKKNNADNPGGAKEFNSVVVNGTLGIIQSIEKDHVVIALENLTQVKIFKQVWTLKIKNYNTSNYKWEEKVIASYEQIPLSLAWAISMHKSQGQSFDRVQIDPSRIFAAGQLYVAVSRCRTLQGLKFSTPVNTSKFFADKRVINFYNQL